LSELSCKTQPFETVALKYSSSDVRTILFTDEKDIYIGYTENHKESPTVRNCRNQAQRRRDKTPAHTSAFRQTLMASFGMSKSGPEKH